MINAVLQALQHERDTIKKHSMGANTMAWAHGFQLSEQDFNECEAARAATDRAVRALSQSMDRYSSVSQELARALVQFPTWPTDPLHALAIVGEEFGELTKAVWEHTYQPHRSTLQDVHDEAIQLAAMVRRFLASIYEYEFHAGTQHTQADV